MKWAELPSDVLFLILGQVGSLGGRAACSSWKAAADETLPTSLPHLAAVRVCHPPPLKWRMRYVWADGTSSQGRYRCALCGAATGGILECECGKMLA